MNTPSTYLARPPELDKPPMKSRLPRREFVQSLLGLGAAPVLGTGLTACGGGGGGGDGSGNAAPSPAPPPPLQIKGATWSPTRDADGRVLASDWTQLPTMRWFFVSDAVLDRVIETPRYPKAKASSGDASANIVAAWGGAAWDHQNQIMYISGGGHGDTHECETGIYALNAAQMQFRRVVNRAPLEMVQSWNFSQGEIVPRSSGNATNMPLRNGVPAAIHSYDGLVWIPPGLPGAGANAGGLFCPGNARAIVNLDSGQYSIAHWFKPTRDSANWSYCTAFLDGGAIYGPHDSFAHFRFELAASEATDWSTQSLGRMSFNAISSSTALPYANRSWTLLRERREQVCLFGDARGIRVRHGQALDAQASNWTTYHEPLSLSSSDGSHLDFNPSTLADDGALANAGMHYDHSRACIWVQSNAKDGGLYRIDGLEGPNWRVSRQAGPAALLGHQHGTWGRFRIARLAGADVAIRLSSTTEALQVLRLS